MPRFHFHVHDGVDRMDAEGTILPNIDAARAEALKLAGRIIGDAGLRRDFGDSWHLDVTDDTGLVLFHIDFFVAASPASGRARESFDFEGR